MVVRVVMNFGQRLWRGYWVQADSGLHDSSTRVQVGLVMVVEMKFGEVR